MKKFFSKIAQRAFALAISIMVVTNTFAQGAAGIDAASSELATYMDPLGNMMMILGGIIGLIGAVRVYLNGTLVTKMYKRLLWAGWGHVSSSLYQVLS